MAYREFEDSDGVPWRAWSTVPSPETALRGGFNQGWLTFERTTGARTELRRLVPLPPGWAELPDGDLEVLCRAATEVRRFGTEGASQTSTSTRPSG